MKPPKFRGRLTNYYKNKLWEYLKFHITPSNPKNLEQIKNAYNLAFAAHRPQRRKGGNQDPYITHPVEVAIICSKEMGFGTTTVMAALLHDVVEDSDKYNLAYIRQKFGAQIATIVDGVTKITKVSGKENSEQIATFINMITTIPKDFRVFIVKVADRLHNMRTMEDMPDSTRKIKSSENLYLYGKIAELVGLWDLKIEIENRSFEYLNNDVYKKLLAEQEKHDFDSLNRLDSFQKTIYDILKQSEHTFEIKTIQHSFYSVWNKMKSRNLRYQDVHNHFSTRIIIDIPHKMNRHTAYPIYWLITDVFNNRRDSLRDWIIRPKKNGFRALVFDVMFRGHWQELQIISKDDNEIAEHGFLNKDEGITPGFDSLENAIKNDFDLREDNVFLIDKLQELVNTETIYLFTPKGEMIEMPKHSTILDFAFRIHTDIGLKCIGAKINDNQAVRSPRNILESSQKIEILTSSRTNPKREWLNFVKTSRAKKALLNYFSKIDDENEKDIENKKEYEINYRKSFTIDDNVEYIAAKCCNPMIGDKAMLYLTKSGNIVVHKESCKFALELRARDSKRTSIVEWKRAKKKNSILTTLFIQGEDRIGIIKDIVNIISADLGINMKKISVENFDGNFKGQIELYISTVQLMNEVIDKIRNLDSLQEVKRIENGNIYDENYFLFPH